ncbi:hypothetical protein [Hymenobacter sediminicola]|uniref:Tetratricopeptide repeat protein n=1 Tax=Hymenobacter sediminicola TaxID=2761579 RepID=A0A7G7W4X6_9BACT|nr:hypothetical protein [Hymenobacter sediminicola]QNH61419.1 hypothetical protein H4317_14820 [Hymenobacter sediminicola]
MPIRYSISRFRAYSTMLALVSSIASAQAQTLEEAGKLYMSGQLDQLIAQGEASLRKNDQQPILHLFVGRAYADQNRFSEAIPHLEKSRQAPAGTDGVKVWSLGYLGTSYYFTDQPGKAQMALEECVALNNTQNATKYAQRRLQGYQLLPFYAGWKVVETAHLRLHFQSPEQVPDLAQYAAEREQAYQAISQKFPASLAKKIDFYVWNNKADAKPMLQRELGFAVPEAMLLNARQGQTRGHELAHVLVQHSLQPAQRAKLINEGIAVYLDQTSTNRMQRARQFAQGRADVWRLWEHPEEADEAQLYAVGGALLEYLAAHATPEQFRALLKDQRADANRATLGPLVAAFEQELAKPE